MPCEDSSRPFVVVLSGGPSAGKSSALALLKARLSARNYQVVTVPETATHFFGNSEGFQPEWLGTDAYLQMQVIFMDHQIHLEESFKAFSKLHPTKRAVLLLDCCIFNSKVYSSDEVWQQLLNYPGRTPTSDEELMARYDMVVHMTTCATKGHYEYGPGSNNPARYHTPEQAKEQDDRCLEVFAKHPQLRMVPYCEKFSDKISQVAEFVNDALHIEGLTGKRQRSCCTVINEEQLKAVLAMPETSTVLVTTVFLDEGRKHSVRRQAKIQTDFWAKQFALWREGGISAENWNVSVSLGREASFERRSQEPSAGELISLTRQVITIKDYYAAVRSCSSEGKFMAHKLVLQFLDGHRYYELIFFVGRDNLILDSIEDDQNIPSWLRVADSQSVMDSAEVPEEVAAEANGPKGELMEPPKKKRALRVNSTEEAAFLQ